MYFAKVRLDSEAATVVWPNGADLAPEMLYAEARKKSSDRRVVGFLPK
jgi:hypothetical protein